MHGGATLRQLFATYTPLFIGYGGHDDTLMDLLESLDRREVKGQMIWCHYETSEPSDRIRALVEQHGGALVSAPGFDLLMILLGEILKIGLLDQEIDRRAKERVRRYQQRIRTLDISKYSQVAEAFARTIKVSGGPLAWTQRAELERDARLRELVYRRGLDEFPGDPDILFALGCFLWQVTGNLQGAREAFEAALKREDHIVTRCNLAGVLLSEGNLADARTELENLNLDNDRKNDVDAILATRIEKALYTIIIEAIERNGTAELLKCGSSLSYLRDILAQGFDRDDIGWEIEWSFDSVLGVSRGRLNADMQQTIERLASGILNESSLPEAMAALDALRPLVANPIREMEGPVGSKDGSTKGQIGKGKRARRIRPTGGAEPKSR